MTERQRQYRANCRRHVAGRYNDWLRVIVIYIIDFTALHVYVSNLHQVCWWERPTIPAASLMCNSFERAVHRYVMHRRGLLEHLSNGYDARFVKSDLRRTLTTPHPRGAVPAPAE